MKPLWRRADAMALAIAAATLWTGSAAAQDSKNESDGRFTREERAILEAARAIERRRLKVIDAVVPAVAAVFPGAVGQGGGSGVIIHPRGYLLTNFHVVKMAREVNIGLSDGKVYRADVLSIDPGGDIALARVRGKKAFPYVELGVSDDLTMGERVYAMGNPFLLATDFKPTITEGLVSGVHRFRGSGPNLMYGDCIQTDAAINPGNSGGPLFNARGQLIGINGLGGFRQERGRFNVGVGYAASIDQIKNFLGDLRAGGQVEHGTMDATVADRKQPLREDLTEPVFDQMFEDSVAYRAGLRIGDRILSLNGRPITSQNRFLTYLSRLPKGQLVRVEVERRREGKKQTITAGFRLAGLPSGPKPGEYPRLPKLAAEELTLILKDFAAANPEKAGRVVLSGVRHQGQARLAFEDSQAADGAFSLRLGEGQASRSWRFDGKALSRKDGDGSAVEYEPDDEAFLALVLPRRAQRALRKGELAKTYAKVELEGGEMLEGEQCLKVGVTDKRGRYVQLLIGMWDHRLRGVTALGDDGDTYIQTIYRRFQKVGALTRPAEIIRRRWSDGELLSRDEIATITVDGKEHAVPKAEEER